MAVGVCALMLPFHITANSSGWSLHPRNVIGLEKGLPNEEMEKLMMTHITVKEDDLRLLATKRAETVADAIRGEGQFEAGRVFVVEPKTLQPEEKKDVKRSRVDFRLK